MDATGMNPRKMIQQADYIAFRPEQVKQGQGNLKGSIKNKEPNRINEQFGDSDFTVKKVQECDPSKDKRLPRKS